MGGDEEKNADRVQLVYIRSEKRGKEGESGGRNYNGNQERVVGSRRVDGGRRFVA